MLDKILVVSDSIPDCETIRVTLSDCAVLVANNISEALTHLEANSDIRLLFLDVDLPERAGYFLLALLKLNERFAGIRVIVMSERNDFSDAMKSPELAGLDYLPKPIKPEPLKIIVHLQSEIVNQNDLVKKMSSTNYLFDLLFNEAPLASPSPALKRAVRAINPCRYRLIQLMSELLAVAKTRPKPMTGGKLPILMIWPSAKHIMNG